MVDKLMIRLETLEDTAFLCDRNSVVVSANFLNEVKLSMSSLRKRKGELEVENSRLSIKLAEFEEGDDGE